jgi:ribosome-binding protein aMBF1 (putative translation factor)
MQYAIRVADAEQDAGTRWDLRNLLVDARHAAGLTVEQVAQCMGVPPRVVRDYEAGTNDPRLSLHQRYARAVGVRLRVGVEAVSDVD